LTSDDLVLFARPGGGGILRMSRADVALLPERELAGLVPAIHPAGAPLPLSLAGLPLPRVLAEGDSWFAYPRSWILFGDGSNIIHQLHDLGGFDLTSVAANGDEMVEMMSGQGREELVERFSREAFDAMLVSGGGNDIVGQYNIDYLVQPKASGGAGVGLIDAARFARRLQQIRDAYVDLLELVARFAKNPQMPVVTHTYDRPIPSGKGAKFVGGVVSIKAWIKPYLDPLAIPVAEQKGIVDEMLRQFENMLTGLEQAYPGRLCVARTQGTIDPVADWKDEIHPTPGGFRKIAGKLKAVLDRVV
jgi:hypothetical protein